MYDPLLRICGTIIGTYTFYLMDRALNLMRFQKPYYAVHVLHNIGIVALTAGDVATTLTNFYEIPYLPFNWPAVCLCYALHFYHCSLYWRSFHLDDWLHHGLMIGVAMPLGSTVSAGSLMGFSLFFTTGLPGAISYSVLFAERNGWISRSASKRANAAANVWIRAPGCSILAGLIVASILSNRMTSQWEMAVGFCIAGLNYWNGQYFMQQSVWAAAINTAKAELADVNNRGPKVDE